jgi:tetrapyrrole methylase family protein / MazG family protein
MDSFDKLLSVADALFGPNGCLWDKKQTFDSLKKCFIEESYELIEAIDEGDNEKIISECADLFYAVIFISKIAEKDNKFNIDDIIKYEIEKLISRHPHVFGNEKVNSSEEVEENWEKIKSTEKHHKDRKSILDGIPKALPSMMYAQKVVQRLKRNNKQNFSIKKNFENEEDLGKQLFELIVKAEMSDMDAELALKKFIDKKMPEIGY